MLLTAKLVYDKLNGAIGINRVRTMMSDGTIPSAFDGYKYTTTEDQLRKFIKKMNVEIEIKNEKLNKIRRIA